MRNIESQWNKGIKHAPKIMVACKTRLFFYPRMLISKRQLPAGRRKNYQVQPAAITFDAFLTIKKYPMSNELLPVETANETEVVEVKKQAKIAKWFSLAGMLLQALASIFSKKN